MKFKIHIAFPILFIIKSSREITSVLCAITIFYEWSFWLLRCITTTGNKLNRCKALVLVAYKRKTLYFHKIVRNDDVTPFKKSGKSACKWAMVYTGVFSRFGLFKRTSSKCIPSGLIHAKETSFSTKRKVVKDN